MHISPLRAAQRRAHALGTLALALVLSGCGGDSTGPPEPPPNVNVGGGWNWASTDLSGTITGIAFVCDFQRTLHLVQTGLNLSGSIGAAELSCRAGTAQESVIFGSENIVNGSVNGNSVRFDFTTQDMHHEGTASGTCGTSMNGTATYRLDFGGDVGLVVLTGSWRAIRRGCPICCT